MEPLRERPARGQLAADSLELHVRELELLLQDVDGAVKLFQLPLHDAGHLGPGLTLRECPLELRATLTLGFERCLELFPALDLRSQRPLELLTPHASPRQLHGPLLQASEQLGTGHARVIHRHPRFLACLDFSTIPTPKPVRNPAT